MLIIRVLVRALAFNMKYASRKKYASRMEVCRIVSS